jgi:hypothetical protein
MDEIRLVLIRGLPGSGKSTLAKTRFADFFHLEADMFFIDSQGGYNWNHSDVGEAHKWCQNTARVLLNLGFNGVVSNSFTELWEMNPYFDMVDNAEIQVTEVDGHWKNTHNISDEKIEVMRQRWEVLPYEDWEYIEPEVHEDTESETSED